jgi:hypothetical protein
VKVGAYFSIISSPSIFFLGSRTVKIMRRRKSKVRKIEGRKISK